MEVQIIDLKKVKAFKYSDDGLKVEFVPLEKGLSVWHRNQMKLRRQYKNRNKLRFTDYFLLKKYPELRAFYNMSKAFEILSSR